MAKSARASSKKINHTKLRARVFGPAEKARAERIHAKLLETINQPKPEKPAAMEVEESPRTLIPSLRRCTDNIVAPVTEAKEDDLPKGLSFLTASIPRSLSDTTTTNTTTTTTTTTTTITKHDDSTREDRELRNLCFHLGLCSDIVGFNDAGYLQLAFDPLPPHWLGENQGLTTTA
ncbi:hypothetical protein J1614_005407 [Plenodomus biglobosus]|nr:hypothetical protein J1614_005407 [Plenodomus biglobosus]